MSKFEDAKLWMGVKLREHKEKAEAKRAQKALDSDPATVTIPLSLVRSAKLAAWMAYFSLVYFLWLYTLDIARDRAASLHLTHVGGWIGDIQFYFPYIVGFAVVAVGIPYVAKIAIPTFMSLSWRGNFWPKLWALFIATAVSLVVIAGTFTVQGDTIMERDRDAAVAVEQVNQGRAALEAQIESRRQELADMMNNSNAYLAQAASVGAAEWERSYIAQARAINDPQLARIERALGAARSADTARAEINALRTQLAQSTAVASVQGEVVTERTSWIADTLGWLEGVRAILLSLVMDIVCLIMPWIALRLEQARNRQMGMAGGIPLHPYMLADRREEADHGEFVSPQKRSAQDVVDAMIAGGADPRFAADMARTAARTGVSQEEMYDAETGQKLSYRKGTWVKPPVRKGKVREGTFQAESGEGAVDRSADHDGGNRTAVKLAGEMEIESVERTTDADPEPVVDGLQDAAVDTPSAPAEPSRQADSAAVTENQDVVQNDLSEELPLFEEELAAGDVSVAEENTNQEQAEVNAIPEIHHETSQREEPETREDRMLPSSYAAE